MGVESDILQPNPKPPILGFSCKLQRVQVLQYRYLVAARCTSHQIQKVSEQMSMHAHTDSTRLQTQSQEPKSVTRMVNEQESESTTVTKSPSIRDTQSSHTISRFKPFCTLSISATHPVQKSSAEGSWVLALDAEHLRTLQEGRAHQR